MTEPGIITGTRRLLSFLSRRHPVAAFLLALSVAAGLGFGWQIGSSAARLFAPAHAERPIEPWMTPRYVARSWGLPPPVVFGLLPTEPQAPPPNAPRPLSETIESEAALERFRHDIEAARVGLEGSRP